MQQSMKDATWNFDVAELLTLDSLVETNRKTFALFCLPIDQYRESEFSSNA